VGEQQIQPPIGLGQAAQQKADVLDEAEIEHTIGLIQNHHLDGVQIEHLLLEIIDNSPRRTD